MQRHQGLLNLVASSSGVIRDSANHISERFAKSHHRLALGSFRLVRRRFGFSCIMAASGVRIFS